MCKNKIQTLFTFFACQIQYCGFIKSPEVLFFVIIRYVNDQTANIKDISLNVVSASAQTIPAFLGVAWTLVDVKGF